MHFHYYLTKSAAWNVGHHSLGFTGFDAQMHLHRHDNKSSQVSHFKY